MAPHLQLAKLMSQKAKRASPVVHDRADDHDGEEEERTVLVTSGSGEECTRSCVCVSSDDDDEPMETAAPPSWAYPVCLCADDDECKPKCPAAILSRFAANMVAKLARARKEFDDNCEEEVYIESAALPI